MNQFSLLRSRAGVSRSELAIELGIPEDTVNSWESGQSSVPNHVMRSLGLIASFVDEVPSEPCPSDIPLVSLAEPVQQGFPWAEVKPQISKEAARTGAFTDNMKLPVHRWFRYSAGFSAAWVAGLLSERRGKGKDDLVLDPFAGSGTALLAARSVGVPSAGAEQHPFVHRIACAKLRSIDDATEFVYRAERVLAEAKRNERSDLCEPELLQRCYTPEGLTRLVALREAVAAQGSEGSVGCELLWLSLTSILRECSSVGTAQWQYVLPNKSKAKVVDPYVAFSRRVALIRADLAAVRDQGTSSASIRLERDDARTLGRFADLREQVTFVITSPPYPNNYDYADATRLEMTFWGEVASWGDLHRAVRQELVCSCSQHSTADRLRLEDLLANSVLEPIVDELREVTEDLAEVRESKGGKKTYHTMVAAYFVDLAKVWRALRPLCAEGADICFVVGDSAPYGVHVPVEHWLGKLAVAAGFREPHFEKIRDRNTKWKNRKHRVPLKEGSLWLKV